LAHTPPPGAGAPRRKRAEKTPPKAAHLAHAHTRHQSRCACVSRGYPHAAGHCPAPPPAPQSSSHRGRVDHDLVAPWRSA